MITDDFITEYDNESGGPFTVGEILTFGGGATAKLITLRDDGTTGFMYFSKISGTTPADNESITGGTSSATADVNGTPFQSRFPLKLREDISIAANADIRWTGPGLGVTHSCDYDGESGGPFTAGEIINFSGGGKAVLVEFTDNGSDGELRFRLIGTTIPLNNETITGATSGATAAVNGVVQERAYRPIELHRLFGDLGDDELAVGNDNADRTKPKLSDRSTDEIITLVGDANIDDTLSYHLYGGSITQAGGDVVYSGLNIQYVDPDGESIPVIIQNNALLSATTTDYWKNSYMADAIQGQIRILVKTRTAAADIDGKRVRGRLLEYGNSYFTGDTTLGTGTTGLSLFSSVDGNNDIAEGTAATYTDVTVTEGYQTIDFNNGNGAVPFYQEWDLGTRTKKQAHNRFKYNQRRGTAETVHGINYQLFVGATHNCAYDAESGGPFQEDEILTFGNGATGLLLALDDQGTTGTVWFQLLTGVAPTDNDTITGGTSSATANVNGAVTARTINNQFFGSFTGSDFNPANFGIALEAADAGSGDKFTDLLGAEQVPPNNQQGIVNCVVGDSVTAYPWDGVSTDPAGDPEPDFDQLSVNGALTGGVDTTVVVDTIPDNTPQVAALRIVTSAGLELVPYTSHDGSTTFTLAGTIPNNVADNADAMIAYIDKVATSTQESYTAAYNSNQQLVVRLTNGGASPIKPAPTTATFGSGGFNVTPTRISDL